MGTTLDMGHDSAPRPPRPKGFPSAVVQEQATGRVARPQKGLGRAKDPQNCQNRGQCKAAPTSSGRRRLRVSKTPGRFGQRAEHRRWAAKPPARSPLITFHWTGQGCQYLIARSIWKLDGRAELSVLVGGQASHPPPSPLLPLPSHEHMHFGPCRGPHGVEPRQPQDPKTLQAPAV